MNKIKDEDLEDSAFDRRSVSVSMLNPLWPNNNGDQK